MTAVADTVSVTQAVLLRAFKLVDGIAGEINGVPNEPTDDMADDIAMDLAEALGVPFDEHWPEAAAEALASTQPAPAFPREEVARETQAVWRCGIGDVTGALDVLKNQWVNSRRKNEREAGATLAKVCDLIWAARGPAPSTYREAATAGKQLIDRVKSTLLQGKQP